jgi:hypothetical protein
MSCACQSGDVASGSGSGVLLSDQAAPPQNYSTAPAPAPATAAVSSNAKLFLGGLLLFFVIWVVMESSRGRKDG